MPQFVMTKGSQSMLTLYINSNTKAITVATTAFTTNGGVYYCWFPPRMRA